jgi:hypothetical protein
MKTGCAGHINVHTTLLVSIVDQIPATSSRFLCTIFSNVGVHALCGQRFILISDYSVEGKSKYFRYNR